MSREIIVEGEVVDTGDGEVRDAGVALARHQELNPAARQMVRGLLRPVEDLGEIMAGQQQVREVVSKALVKGRDWGTIPGTDKPTLYQPGADMMCATYGLMPRFRLVEVEVDHDREVRWTKQKWTGPTGRRKKVAVTGVSVGLYRYVVECQLVHRESGIVIGHGIGSCSSLESKYVDRPRDLENTILKMAKKRAHADAVLTTLGLHDMFGQADEETTNGAPAAAGPPAKPAGKKVRKELEALAGHIACPEDVADFLRKELERGEALSAERAALLAQRAKAAIEEEDAQETDAEGDAEEEPDE